MLESLMRDIQLIRVKNPLVHNVTNFVTMDFIASGLLALGASPVMSHSIEEIKEMVSISSSVVINIGTLDESWEVCFKAALDAAKHLNKPVILDPVGAGATTYRTRLSRELLEMGGVSIIRGNASEIMAVAGEMASTKGVDSANIIEDALGAARRIAQKYNVCVVVSGKRDAVVSSGKEQIFEFGDPMMAKVVGMGCFLTSVVGAFHAINKSAFESAAHAVMLFGAVGEIAINKDHVHGPASFKSEFIDQLYNLEQYCEIQSIINRGL